jgi:hypothetical protein
MIFMNLKGQNDLQFRTDGVCFFLFSNKILDLDKLRKKLPMGGRQITLGRKMQGQLIEKLLPKTIWRLSVLNPEKFSKLRNEISMA